MYFITQVASIENLDNFDKLTETANNESRTIGYTDSFTEADYIVRYNKMWDFEKPLGYIIVERIEEGVHPMSETMQWYKYQEEEETYEPMEDFDSLVVNFAMIG